MKYAKCVSGIIASSLEFEFPGPAVGAEYNGARCSLLGEYLPIVEPSLTLMAAEAMLVPLASQRLDILADDRCLAHLALGRTAFRPLCLAIDTPCVAVLLNVCHAMLKRVAALGAEEMPVMPMRSKRHNMLSKDGSRAVLAAWSEEFVPVEMAIEAESFVSVFRHGHARLLVQYLTGRATPNPLHTLSP